MQMRSDDTARSVGTRVLAVFMAASMVTLSCPLAAFADDDEQTVRKNEIVYIKASASGASEGLYVVNYFNTDEATTLQDPGTYTSVLNLSTSEQLEQSDEGVSLTTLAGEPFYYQGNLASDTQLPWDIDIRYELDGASVSEQDVAGATGTLAVTIEIEPNEEEDVADFAESYLVMAQGTFQNESFEVSDGGDATIAHAGATTVATCLVLPGRSMEATVVGEATEFEYDGWQISAMPLSLAIDLANEDLDEMTESFTELQDAILSASQGATELADGSSQLDTGADSLASGTSALSTAVTTLQDATATLDDGADELADASDTLADGLDSLSSSSSTLSSGWSAIGTSIGTLASASAQLLAGSESYEAALEESASAYASGAAALSSAQSAYEAAFTQVYTELATTGTVQSDTLSALNDASTAMSEASAAYGAYGALESALEGYEQLGSGIESLASGTEALDDAGDTFGDGLETYTDAVESASDGASALASGSDTLASGTDELKSGTGELDSAAGTLASGANSLSSATSTLESGSQELSSGLAELVEATDGLDEEVIDEVQDKIDEMLGSDFDAHSFVEADNTDVGAVQFVYVIDGVTLQDDEEEEAEEEESTFLSRLKAVFTSIFGGDES